MAGVIMYDGVNAALLPKSTVKAAGYVNGDYPSYGAIVKRFPRARVFGISVNGLDWDMASIVDWEKGDVQSESKLRNFCINRNEFRQYTACVYVSYDNLEQVEGYLSGVWHYLWVANWGPHRTAGTSYTGTKAPNTGSLIVSTQVESTPGYDVSDTLSTWT